MADTWVTKTAVPGGAAAYASCVVGTDIWLFDVVNDRTLKYDTLTDTWTSSYAVPSSQGFSVSPGTRCEYVAPYIWFPGFNNNGNVMRYDIAGDAFSHTGFTVQPTRRLNYATCVYNGLVYVLGGDLVVGNETAVVQAYDPVGNSWTTFTSMPTAREVLSGAVVAGVFYALGGHDITTDTWLATNEGYDLASDSWASLTSMPTARGDLVVAAAGGKVYAIGGFTGPSTYRQVNEQYDPVTDTWATKAPMTSSKEVGNPSNPVVNGVIYAIGGETGGGGVATNYAYTAVDRGPTAPLQIRRDDGLGGSNIPDIRGPSSRQKSDSVGGYL